MSSDPSMDADANGGRKNTYSAGPKKGMTAIDGNHDDVLGLRDMKQL